MIQEGKKTKKPQVRLSQNWILLLFSPFLQEISPSNQRLYSSWREKSFWWWRPREVGVQVRPIQQLPSSQRTPPRTQVKVSGPRGVGTLTALASPILAHSFCPSCTGPVAAHQTCLNGASASGYLACFALCLEWVSRLIHARSLLSSVLPEAANRCRVNHMIERCSRVSSVIGWTPVLILFRCPLVFMDRYSLFLKG